MFSRKKPRPGFIKAHIILGNQRNSHLIDFIHRNQQFVLYISAQDLQPSIKK